jgi:hypothetical protein
VEAVAQPSKNGDKILSVAAAVLFAPGGIYYGLLLWDSVSMMRHTIRETADGLAMEAGGIPLQAIPCLCALLLLILCAAIQFFTLARPGFSLLAATAAAVPLLFPLFTDVRLAEFTRVGILPPVSAIKYIPFAVAAILWSLRGIRSLIS